jgi:hypothetical protein
MVEYHENTIFLKNDQKVLKLFSFHFHIFLSFSLYFSDNCFHFHLALKVDKISKMIFENQNFYFCFHPSCWNASLSKWTQPILPKLTQECSLDQNKLGAAHSKVSMRLRLLICGARTMPPAPVSQLVASIDQLGAGV